MTTTVLLVCSLIAAGPTAADLASYEAARATVGRAPEANIQLALWCEAHGLQAERLKHLARAVLSEPTNAMARGLMGLVAYQGHWKRPEAVARKVQADQALVARLAEYNARRSKAHETADSQWSLAIWCEQNGLEAEALAHFTAVTRLDPSRDAAWKRLDCKKVNGRWRTEAQIVAEKDEAEAQKKADKLWKPLLTKYRSMLADKRKKDAAEQALLNVTDPRAVPMVWSVFVAGNSAYHDRAVQLLGQIDAAASSRALAYLAVFDDSAEVRRAATETLRRRDPREFAGMLVALLRDPLKYEVRPVGGPGSPGALFVQGQRINVQRIYAPPAAPALTQSGDWIDVDANGMPYAMRSGWSVGRTHDLSVSPLAHMNAAQFRNYHTLNPAIASAVSDFHTQYFNPDQPFLNMGPNNSRLRKEHPALADQIQGINIVRATTETVGSQTNIYIPIGQIVLEHQKAALSAQQQLERDAAAIDEQNTATRQFNDRVTSVLREVARRNPGESAKAWQSWWIDVQGYAFINPPAETPRPTLVENVPLDYLPAVSVSISTSVGSSIRSGIDVRPYSEIGSCFGAGTLVRTLDGSKPIETIRVGDRVLTQDVKSGALGYQPVTVIHHNPPSPTFLVKVGKDTIVSSPFHRFWIAGTGWKMARDLKGGEILRLLEGPARVDSVEDGPVQLVYNLDIAGDHDFFAGASAVLVHDNTLPDTRLVAFDAAPVVAVAESSGR